MSNRNYSPIGNRIYIIFFALPIFFLAWWQLGYLYALVIGIGSAALLYTLFVWLPADQIQKNLRKIKFADARKAIKAVRKQSNKIDNTKLKLDLKSAAELAEGLVTVLETEPKHQGKVEESLLPMLTNMLKQIERWLLHESGKQPLTVGDQEKLLGIMFNYDTLFLKYQEGGLRSDEFLTSLYHSETAMLELGIDIQDVYQGDRQA
jgi:hypothetical protein